MKDMRTLIWTAAVFFALIAVPLSAFAQTGTETEITEWEMKWVTISKDEAVSSTPFIPISANGWLTVHAGGGSPPVPDHVNAVWIKVKLPKIHQIRSGLYIKGLYAQNIEAFIDGKKVYSAKRDFTYSQANVLLPLTAEDSNKDLFFFISNDSGNYETIHGMVVGDYQVLHKFYFVPLIIDVVLGSSFLLIAFIMLICFVFLNRSYLKGWGTLSLVIFTIGLVIISYSVLPYTNDAFYGSLFLNTFDLSTNILLPSFFLFFETLYGKGPFSLITIFKKISIGIGLLSFAGFAVNVLTANEYYNTYYALITFIFLIYLIAGSLVLIALLVYFCLKGDKNAIIITIGIGIFILITSAEAVSFFVRSDGSRLHYWKWGALCFAVSLIVVLGRKISENFERVVTYSKQLEVYNNELQRSEKMEIISQLAASVAHEVRNPLQVTRGFLQLLGEKTRLDREKNYMVMAINELDRASDIITDFLTFAKPQIEQISVLDIKQEFRHIEGILLPLANLQGGQIHTRIEDGLYVNGNSQKFKQALINIIKNSIEALSEEGRIEISGYREAEEVCITISDNGEGMSESEIEKLGQPYFTNKSKGTGLGLMVTFRIVEVMEGKIKYESARGVGTTVTLRFPHTQN